MEIFILLYFAIKLIGDLANKGIAIFNSYISPKSRIVKAANDSWILKKFSIK